MTREYRAMPLGEIRAVGDRQFEARVCVYNVTDDYGSVWLPGCWSQGLRAKLPKVVFSHDWERVIGSVVDYRDGPEGLDVTVQLADFDAVPDARMTHALLRDGHLDSFSFGFVRNEWRAPTADEQARWPGAKELMEAATMDEASPVLVGAVPGTRTLAVRSAEGNAAPERRTLSTALIQDVALLMREGAIDPDGAREILRTGELPAASTQPPDEAPDPGPPTPSAPGHIDATPEVEAPEAQEPSPAASGREQAEAEVPPEVDMTLEDLKAQADRVLGSEVGDGDLDAAEALAVIGGRSRA